MHLYNWGNNQLLLMNNYLACIAVIAWEKGAWDVRKNQKIGQRGQGEESVHLSANWSSEKCRLCTDCGLLFLVLENNGTIVVMYSFAW